MAFTLHQLSTPLYFFRKLAVLALAILLPIAPVLAQSSLKLGVVLEPPHLDPTTSAAAAIDEIVYQNVFEGLTRIDAQGHVQPSLATSWRPLEGGMIWEFTLRTNVQFHNGTPFNAKTVVFSLQRAAAPASLNAQKRLFEPIARVEEVGVYRVHIHLRRGVADFPRHMAWGDAVMVEPTSAPTNATMPVGTGPFRLDAWQRGEYVRLRAAEQAWRKAKLDMVTFLFIADPNAALAALLTKRVDGFPNFPAPEASNLIRNEEDLELVIGTTEGETILALNNNRSPFGVRGNRCALTRAIDREQLIALATFGTAHKIGSHFAPHHPYYVDLTSVHGYDPQSIDPEALESLQNRRLSLVLPPPSYARRSGELIATQLDQIGIKVDVEEVGWSDWLTKVFKNQDFDMTIVAHTEPNDIEIYAREQYYFGFRNSDAHRIWQSIQTTLDPKLQAESYADFQRLLADHCVNVFLFQLPKIGVWRKGLKGMWHNLPTQANDVTEVYWE